MLRNAWILAIEAFSWVELQRLNERLAIAKTAKQLRIADTDAIKLAHRLVCETIRRQNFIDTLVNNVLAPNSINNFRLGVRAFLRLYTYMAKIENCSYEEAVNIARLGRAILGWKELREVEEALSAILSLEPVSIFMGLSDEERVGLLTYHPTWFVKYCFKLFGRGEALRFLEGNIKAPPTYIRINTLKASEKTVLERLKKDEIRVERVKPLKHTFKVLQSNKPLTRTPSFNDGLFYVQDKASCLAGEIANPKPSMTVLDICAAPGAKTTHLAQMMRNKGVIYSLDYSRRRMTVWKNEITRMGVEIAVPMITDACNPLSLTIEADIVVLDPPCTSTGAFGKFPSAKWRLTRRSVDKMAEIQWQMINSCAENVKPGGTLIYSTCSITVEENEVLIERFLKWHPEFSLDEITPKIGLSGLRGMEKCQRLYPHIHQCNGFFIAKLLKSRI